MSAPLSPTITASSSGSPRITSLSFACGPPSTRRRLAPAQTSALVSVFEVKTHPTREERALLAAELGMELKAVNAWFQNKRRSLKKTWSSTNGWSKGSLPENKHVRPSDGPKALPPSDSVISLERVVSLHELPYKPKGSSISCVPLRIPMTPRRRGAATDRSREIWELLPSSPPTRPSSPGLCDPLLEFERCTNRARSLEWACARARAGRKTGNRRAKALKSQDLGMAENGDVPMLVLDAAPRKRKNSTSSEDTETEEEEAITPNISTDLLLPEMLSADAEGTEPNEPEAPKKDKNMDMEAAIALLGFMGPESAF